MPSVRRGVTGRKAMSRRAEAIRNARIMLGAHPEEPVRTPAERRERDRMLLAMMRLPIVSAFSRRFTSARIAAAIFGFRSTYDGRRDSS